MLLKTLAPGKMLERCEEMTAQLCIETMPRPIASITIAKLNMTTTTCHLHHSNIILELEAKHQTIS